MIAVVCVRDGTLPAGAEETVGEAAGNVVLVGSGCADASRSLAGMAGRIGYLEAGDYAPGRWAAMLAPALAEEEFILLPASPDGRDLAPRLAAELDRPLLAGAVAVAPPRLLLARAGGLVTDEVTVLGPVVATLLPGTRGLEPHPVIDLTPPRPLEVPAPAEAADPVTLAVLPADPATMDLAEARRIVGGGAGLSRADFGTLAEVAAALGASVGGTRVVTDADWLPFERQIGTTGAIVNPDLYLAFGISGAVQHVSGLGSPDAVVAVNTDPSCPMMAMADLALVTDAGPLLVELARRLGAELPSVDPSTEERRSA